MSTYLDHAATSPMRSEAREALLTELGRVGNPSSQHRAGQRARRRLEEAREELAAALGAHPGEVIFTSGGSEADSIAILGSLAARPERPRSLISAVEHPAVQEARGRGAEVLAVNSRGVVEDTTWEAADEKVAVISVVRVNNETGVIHPLDGLVAASSRTGAWSHSDAVQALGHVPLDFHATGLDLMSVSAHKIGGPVGIGALVVRRGVTPAPIGLGGGQEGRIRSGTLPVALAASFAAAATAAVAGLEAESERLLALRDGIRETASACGGRINGENCAPHVVSATFPGIRAQDLLFLLDAEDIHASAGSACRAGVYRPSEVLLAMGAPEDEAMSTVRFSLGHTSGRGDVDRLREVLPVAVERARAAG